MKRSIVWAVVLVFGLVPGALAQLSTGNINGTITDESGAVLPGVNVILTGDFGTRSTTTGDEGLYRFVRVDHGTHTLNATLSGFAGVSREILVTIGTTVSVDFSLAVATVEETITVTAETPVVDSKKLGTDVAVQRDELNRIPTAREPWALMRSVPGILVDRVNLAGSFYGKGSSDKDQTWTIDGMVVTDEVSWSSPTYWNYDSFDEINFVTGGQDISVASGGIGVNIVTKRGTNTFHGGGSYFYTSDAMQGSNLPDSLVGDPRLQGNDKADHTDKITDYSFNLGGPILKDKLWFFGSYGKNDIQVLRLVQTRDETILKNTSAKLNWQAGSSDMISLMYFNGAKQKFGRASGSLEQSDDHLYNQGGTKRDGWIDGLSKIEWDHIFSPNFVMNAKYAYYNTGFILTPRGGLDQREYNDYVALEAFGSNQESKYLRPQWTGNIDGHYFMGSHDVRFGATFRRTAYDYQRTQPGDGVLVKFYATGNQAEFYRDADFMNRVNHVGAYMGDTFTRDRLTVNLALRWDRYVAFSLPSTAVANEARPDLLPDLEYQGSPGNVVEWNNIVPRLGITYALTEDRKTVVRLGISRYAGTLPAWTASHDNPVGTSYLRYPWVDANGDRDVQMSEVDFDNLLRASGVDPDNPTAVGSTPSRYDPDYKANTDTEVILGLEHELLPNLAVSAAYTFRKNTNITYQGHSYWYPWLDDSGNVFTSNDFYLDPQTAGGQTFDTYTANDDVWDRITWGLNMMNTPGYSQTFNGFELGLAKRLSNGWMGRFAFSYNNHTQSVGAEGIIDPTRTAHDTLADGGQVAPYASGSGRTYFVNAKWQINANGMYELPAGFEISANLFGRQGYPMPDYARLDHGVNGVDWILPSGAQMGDVRFPNLWNLDMRLANRVKLGDRVNLTLSAELFNVLNSNTLMSEATDLSSSSYGRIDQILAPRIVRMGARLSF